MEAGKHVFCEKPVAVDAPGVSFGTEVIRTCGEKNLSLVSGLCWAIPHGKRATFEQIKSGAIGRIVAMQCSYMTAGSVDPRRTPDQCSSEMEYQMRNWYYYTWLSGDFNVEHTFTVWTRCCGAMGRRSAATISGSRWPTGPHRCSLWQHLRPL